MITQRPFCLKGRQQLSWRLRDARLGHELSRRNCPAYPEREWFAALASADREAPCNEPAIEKPVLGPKQVWNGSSSRWHEVDDRTMHAVAWACDRWWNKYGDQAWRKYGR